MKALYFGTYQQAGHYMFQPGSTWRTMGWSATKEATPWGNKIDGCLNPKREVEGEALLHHKDGWTALAFANRTDDSRPGSNSVFFFDEVLTFDQAVLAAREHFPHVVERFKFEIVLVSAP